MVVSICLALSLFLTINRPRLRQQGKLGIDTFNILCYIIDGVGILPRASGFQRVHVDVSNSIYFSIGCIKDMSSVMCFGNINS